MLMLDFVTKFRRNRWRDQVLIVGRRLRDLEVARAGTSADLWPDVASEIDLHIDLLTRKRDRLLAKLKETS